VHSRRVTGTRANRNRQDPDRLVKVAELSRLRWLLGTLLIAAAALFALGIAT